MADKETNADKAKNEALLLQAKANEAKAKANEPPKTAEQRKADEFAQKADDARARAAELSNEDGRDGDTSAEDAHVALPAGIDPETPAGAWEAVKRSNDPSNPEYAPGVSQDPNEQTVKLSRVTRDHPEPIYTWVHPNMVGDYMRAGWGKAD